MDLMLHYASYFAKLRPVDLNHCMKLRISLPSSLAIYALHVLHDCSCCSHPDFRLFHFFKAESYAQRRSLYASPTGQSNLFYFGLLLAAIFSMIKQLANYLPNLWFPLEKAGSGSYSPSLESVFILRVYLILLLLFNIIGLYSYAFATKPGRSRAHAADNYWTLSFSVISPLTFSLLLPRAPTTYSELDLPFRFSVLACPSRFTGIKASLLPLTQVVFS